VCKDAQAMFNRYFISYSPHAMFNGTSAQVMGADQFDYYDVIDKYEKKISSLRDEQANQPSMIELTGTVRNIQQRVVVETTLENFSANPLVDASLYAVIYERVFFQDGTWHNVVKGVTDMTTINLGVGESKDITLEKSKDSLEYNSNYGVVVILQSNRSREIIQAVQLS